MNPDNAPAGLFQSVRTLLANLTGLLHTRLELVGLELQEAVTRLVVVLLVTVATLLFAFLGIAFGAFAVILAVGEAHRLAAAGAICASFLVIGALLAWWLRHTLLSGPRIFEASLSELRKDRESLMPQR